ncbi:CPBP family intramembrane metalloprotease, partial [Salmonella enterica]|nr:CPBP family intramembrane metalloprotease [Salmonella enterica]
MWIMLALALLVLQFNRNFSIILLMISAAIGLINNTIDWSAFIFIAIISIISLLQPKITNIIYFRYFFEGILVLCAIALTLHLIPGFHNHKVLDAIYVGPQSTPYTMYYNFDKALTPFLLIMCARSLFSDGLPHKTSLWKWGLLCLSVPLLLLVAVFLGGLKPEFHLPSWLFQFILANIFFVSLAEEALFRGYIQQRLSMLIHPVMALIIASVIFGFFHYSGGVLLVVFSTLAGVIYGVAWMWSRRLWISVLFHFGLNIIHLLFFTYP